MADIICEQSLISDHNNEDFSDIVSRQPGWNCCALVQLLLIQVLGQVQHKPGHEDEDEDEDRDDGDDDGDYDEDAQADENDYDGIFL